MEDMIGDMVDIKELGAVLATGNTGTSNIEVHMERQKAQELFDKYKNASLEFRLDE